MSSLRKIAIAFAALLFVALAWYFWPSNEPRYQGKRVSYWFRQYYLIGRGEETAHTRAQVAKALHELGTNALPYLVGQAFSTRQDTAFRTNYYLFLSELPKAWHLPQFVSLDTIRRGAADAIREVNPPAEIILPMLAPGFAHPNSDEYQQAARIVCGVRNHAELLVPCLAGLLSDTNERTRMQATMALARVGTNAAPAIPALMATLDSTNTTLLGYSAITLRAIGASNDSFMPKLEARLKSGDEFDGITAAGAILTVQPDNPSAQSFLIGIISQSGTNQIRAIRAVRNAGPAAKAAIPALQEAVKSSDPAVCIEAKSSLVRIDSFEIHK